MHHFALNAAKWHQNDPCSCTQSMCIFEYIWIYKVKQNTGLPHTVALHFPVTRSLWIYICALFLSLDFCLPSLSLMGSHWAGTADAPVVVVMWDDWWRLEKWEGRHVVYPVHGLNPPCQDWEVRIQLQTRCFFIRISISTHYSSQFLPLRWVEERGERQWRIRSKKSRKKNMQ